MDSAVTYIVLIGCWTVSSSQSSVSFSMVFSSGTRLLVVLGEKTVEWDPADGVLHHQIKTTGLSVGPSVQVFASVQVSQDPGSPHLLVCLLTGLKSPVQPVLWWLNDTVVRSVGGEVPWTWSEGHYSATSVWEVSAADWSSTSTYWCGTVQMGQVYRQKLCSQE